MNRFLTRKRAKESPDTDSFSPDLPSRSNTPTLPKKGKKWGKKQPEPKPQIDIAAVLPSDDNFRTSALMNGLSARFSMLREQDDPNSKLGKASDDSVLQPKRQSRLYDFGFTKAALTDIAEVSSINGSIRPPFAQRQGSFASAEVFGMDDDSTQGSIMSRARPGEGNVLFGGRQKVYRIPVASSTEPRSKVRGKAVYEDDISLSAFQRMRKEEKERQELEQQLNNASEEDTEKDTSYPPSISSSDYMRRRASTSSASHPSIARSSTAATSIASQGGNVIPSSAPAPKPTTGLERSTTKSRRLYEQGLDQHIHEQQTSALTRLNSIQKQRTHIPGKQTPPPFPNQPKSTSNLHDRFNRPNAQAVRGASPPPSASAYKLTTFGSIRESKSSAGSPVLGYPNSPPLSPPAMSDGEETPLTMLLNPEDRGKATAMGAFNKPKQQFDEAQYLQRQKQMLQGSERAASNRSIDSPAPIDEEPGSDYEQDRIFAQNNPSTIQEESEWPISTTQSDHNISQPASPLSSITSETFARNPKMPKLNMPQTFFSSIGSDSEDELAVSPLESSPTVLQAIPDPLRIPVPISPVEQHPAFRSMDAHIIPEIEEEPVPEDQEDTRPGIDSPTLGTDEAALSGLIRQHLREGSGSSSIYGDHLQAPVAPPVKAMPRVPRSRMTAKAGEDPHYTHSNPWDLDEIDSAYFGEADSPVDNYRFQNQLKKVDESSKPAKVDARSSMEHVPWQQELKNKHSRGGSTETQQEREAFAHELEQRKKAIQENMRTRAENDSRAPSPNPGSDHRKVFGMLRNKSSRESIASKYEPSSAKALKRLGISMNEGSNVSLGRTGTRRSQINGIDELDEGSLRGRPAPNRPVPLTNAQRSVEDMRRKWEAHLQRENSSNGDDSRRTTLHSQSSHGPSVRDRSNSEVSHGGRSRSRSGRYRDDFEVLETPKEEQPEATPVVPQQYQALANLKQSQAAALENPTPPASAKLPIINKGKSGYFEPQNLMPPQLSQLGGSRSAPSSGNTSPMLPHSTSNRPSPHGPSLPHSPPYSASSTPPGSALPTPNLNSASFTRLPPPPRKGSIQKHQISEPTLISTTSNFDTVDLPAGASLKNGQEPASPPPLPPMNPLRRRTHKVFNAFGRSDSAPSVPRLRNSPSPPGQSPGSLERANTSPEEDELGWTRRNKLGNKNRSRNPGFVSPPSPPSPQTQVRLDPSATRGAANGAMF
ncbi:MAG: hypothetical protein M1820_005833 [Bogoriella megaspora]|nr:MAG: hypothetical protein M1820_005833 [Bogoriella megaspora]